MPTDLRCRKSQHCAAQFIVESFGDMINDNLFISWLRQKLNYQKCRLEQILKGYFQSQKSKSRRSLPDNTQQKNYEFWFLPENSIMITDRRSGRDEVRISTLKYLKDYKHFELTNDENLTEKEVVLRKSGTIKNISMVNEWFILSLSDKCFNHLPKKKVNVGHCQHF